MQNNIIEISGEQLMQLMKDISFTIQSITRVKENSVITRNALNAKHLDISTEQIHTCINDIETVVQLFIHRHTYNFFYLHEYTPEQVYDVTLRLHDVADEMLALHPFLDNFRRATMAEVRLISKEKTFYNQIHTYPSNPSYAICETIVPVTHKRENKETALAIQYQLNLGIIPKVDYKAISLENKIIRLCQNKLTYIQEILEKLRVLEKHPTTNLYLVDGLLYNALLNSHAQLSILIDKRGK